MQNSYGLQMRVREKELMIRRLEIPTYIMKTLSGLIEVGMEATAKQVANRTGRSYPSESRYLNELHRLGILEKRREGRSIYFKISSDYISKQVEDVFGKYYSKNKVENL